MNKDNRNNEQIYGRNDMVMLDQNNKIYGSLGIADKYVMKTEEGTRLVLSNPKLGKFGDVLTEFNMYGMSSQNKTTGKNLLKYPYIETTKTSQGIMFMDNKDGSINVSGTATGTAYYNLYSNMDGKRLTLASGTYKLVVKGRSKCDVIVNNGVKSVKNEGTITITDGHNEIYCYIVVQEGVTVDETIYPMIQLASITDESYEPYTGGKPSPSPDYPQEIKSVGDSGNIEVNVRGKNLWDNFKKLSLGNVEQKNGTYIATADNMQVDITMESVGARPLLLKANNAYTFSLKTTVSISSPKFVCLRYTNGETNNVIFKNKNFINFVPKRDVEKVGFILYESVAGDKVYDVQLEIGSEATPYEPYQEEQTVALPYILNAIPVSSGGNYTDQSGQQYIADRVVEKDGVFGIERNIATDVPLLTEKLREITDMKGRFIQDYAFKKTFTPLYAPLVNIGYGKAWGVAGNVIDKWIFGVNKANLYISPPKDLNYTSEDAFNALKDLNIKVYGALSVSIFEPLPEDIQSKLRALSTNYPVTIIENNYNTWMKATYKSTESV